jgi:hypothetical protein
MFCKTELVELPPETNMGDTKLCKQEPTDTQRDDPDVRFEILFVFSEDF